MNGEKPVYVYKITCLPNGRAYIGITSSGLHVRWNNHVSKANRETSTGCILRNTIRKYGRDAFLTEVITIANTRKEAEALERKMIVTHNTLHPNGMNLTSGGEGTPDFRRPHSEETKAKMSAAQIGRVPLLAIQNSAAARKGKKLSPQHRERLSESHKGIVRGPEWRANIAAVHRGRSFPKRSIALLKTQIAGGHPSTSGFRGVIQESRNYWTARIGINGRRVSLGSYPTPELAHAAYCAAVESRIKELEEPSQSGAVASKVGRQRADCESDETRERRRAGASDRWERHRAAHQ